MYFPQQRNEQRNTALGFLSMKSQVGAEPGALEKSGADPQAVAAQLAEDRETVQRAARILLASPYDPPSVRMMGLDEDQLADWASPDVP